MGWWAAASTVLQIGGGFSASQKAKAAGKKASKYIMAETYETIRRESQQHKERLGQAKVSIGASGVRMEGTPTAYIGTMAKEHKLQQEWTLRAGTMRARMARKSGQDIGRSAMTSGYTGALNTAGSWYSQGRFDDQSPSGYSGTQPNYYTQGNANGGSSYKGNSYFQDYQPYEGMNGGGQ